MRSQLGPILVALGAGLLLVGLLVWSGMLSWFGQLPGDIRVVRPNARIYVPITSMVILSIVLSAILVTIRRFM